MSQPNAGFRPPEPLDDLTEPLRELDRALLQDGEVTRGQMPAAAEVATRALAQIEAVEPGSQIRSERLAPDTKESQMQPWPGERGATRSRRGFAAVAAMAAVVILVVAVLHAGLTRNVVTPKPTGTTTVTATSIPTPAAPNGQWVSVAGLTGTSIPTFSALDPRLIYEVIYSTTGPSLRRSDDSGATWKSLTIPDVAYPSALIDFVGLQALASPLDLNTVFLDLHGPGTLDCAATPVSHATGGFKARLSGIPLCSYSYISNDRGAHWSTITLPGGGNLGSLDSGIASGQHTVLAQGTRLYAYNLSDSTPVENGRLITSDDHGMTWRTIDEEMVSQGWHVLDYAAARTGETIFAVTSNGQEFAPTYFFWRSDDGGTSWQHWPLSSTSAFTAFRGMAVAPAANGAEPLIYLVGHVGNGEGVPALPTDFYVSRDGGLHWSPAPFIGIPSDLPITPLILGTLSDGSIVVLNYTLSGSTLQFFGWHDGQSTWRALTTPVQADQCFAITHASDSGPDDIWVATNGRGATGNAVTTEVQRYTVS